MTQQVSDTVFQMEQSKEFLQKYKNLAIRTLKWLFSKDKLIINLVDLAGILIVKNVYSMAKGFFLTYAMLRWEWHNGEAKM